MRKEFVGLVAVLSLVVGLSGSASAEGTRHRFELDSNTSLSVEKPRVSFVCNDATGDWKVKVRNVQPITPTFNPPPGIQPRSVWNNFQIIGWYDRWSFGQDLGEPNYDPPYRTHGFVFVSLLQNDRNGLFDGLATGSMDPAQCTAGTVRLTDYSFGDPDLPFPARLLDLSGHLT
jgi:hypothetical protein